MAAIGETKPVRLYFELGVEFAFPDNREVSASPDDGPENSLHCALREEIDARLPAEFDDVQLLRMEKVPQQKNLNVVYFSVSKIHQFPRHVFFVSKNTPNKLKIRKRSLEDASRLIGQAIRNFLKPRYAIDSLCLRYVASRNFIFEIDLSGRLTVEKVFQPEEIKQAGGIRCALDDFLEEMRCAIRESGLEGDASKAYRARNNKNQYAFDLYVACHHQFDETEVDGEMGLLYRPMSPEEYDRIWVFVYYSAIESLIPEVKGDYYRSLEQNLPAEVIFHELEFEYMDHDDITFDVDEEFSMSFSRDQECFS